LDGAILIGYEHDHVHAVEVGAARLGGLRKRTGREQYSGWHRCRGPQQIAPRHTSGHLPFAHSIFSTLARD
jgi:hypothetical protein